MANQLPGTLLSSYRVKEQFRQTLAEIQSPTSFACGSTIPDPPNPGLSLNDYGAIGLPLSQHDAGVIISKARQSPFGKGAETLVDTSVRKSWQLDPTQFSIRNPGWMTMLDKILKGICEGMFLQCHVKDITAELYKLLLYEEGAFFKPHKDSEKTPGMFGTLVVCLPSSHEGGDLVLLHNNEKFEFKTSPSSDFDVSYAAWYSDVLHEVKPVTQGYRLVLVYNLINHTTEAPLIPPTLTSHTERVVKLLKQWYVDHDAPRSPQYLLDDLQHQYTQAGLRLELLRGADLGRVLCLKEAAAKLGFSVYLANLEVSIVKDDEGLDDFEFERTMKLKHVVTLDGVQVNDPQGFPGVCISEENLLFEVDDKDADEEEHSGFTGNEGATATYWYRDTVVVIVPPDQKLKFLYDCDRRPATLLSWIQRLRRDAEPYTDSSYDLIDVCQFIVGHGKAPLLWKAEDKLTWNQILQEIAEAAIQVVDEELLYKVIGITHDSISLECFRLLGGLLKEHWDEPYMAQDMIERALKAAMSLKDMHEAIETVKKAFYESPNYDGCSEKEVAEILEWIDQLSSSAVALTGRRFTRLSKADGESLASFVKSWPVQRIETEAMPLVMQSSIACKIGFANHLLAPTQTSSTAVWQEGETPNKVPEQPTALPFDERLELVKPLMSNIWSNFRLPSVSSKTQPPSFPPSWRASLPAAALTEEYNARNMLNGADLRQLIEHSLSAGVLTEDEVHRLLSAAVHTADKEAYKHTLLPFVEEILCQNVSCYKRDGETGQISQQSKKFVTYVLLDYIKTSVGKEPKGAVNWRQSGRGCGCTDCRTVDTFLASPTETVFRLPCSRARRHHLHTWYNNRDNVPYDIVTLRNSTPEVWQITKKSEHGKRRVKWTNDRDEARTRLEALQAVGPLRDYLGFMADAILAADYDRAAALFQQQQQHKTPSTEASTSRQPLQPSTLNIPGPEMASGLKRTATAEPEPDVQGSAAKKARTESAATTTTTTTTGNIAVTKKGPVEVIDLT